MDRRHGKRPLPPESSEEKEKEHDIPDYASSWSETDMSAMVSALTQVIGTVDDKPSLVQSTPLAIPECAVKEEPDNSTQPVQDQGINTFYFYYLLFFSLFFWPKLLSWALIRCVNYTVNHRFAFE